MSTRMKILKKVATGELTPEQADKKLSASNNSEKYLNDLELADKMLSVCLVPIGYQMDLLDRKEYLNGKIKVLHSECRDYGIDIDVEEFSKNLVDFVRKGNDG